LSQYERTPDSELSVDDLVHLARDIRLSIIDMLETAKSGHSAGPLGMAEILATLYGRALRIRPTEPEWSERDIFLLSNGHTAPVLYAALAHSGFFPVEELLTLRRWGSRLQGHPERTALPGLENTSGPLGSGLSQGAGFAHVIEHIDRQSDRWVYVVMGDGELNEGNIWEAAMYAAKYDLGRLIGIVDRNFIQIDGNTEDVMPLADLSGKWRSFGWHVLEVDGHDIPELLSAIESAKSETTRPSVIIANTVPGRGVSYMEHDFRWHGKVPDATQAAEARASIDSNGTLS
jgi:transketolase